ncbi:MAG: helix-turn-helix transcriptional regulator [Clostridiales bacterium]|nr:helix-turn-helix transcriptional regulator [Clostridiales bacterium]
MYPRIKQLRLDNKLTQIQLSVKLEMDQSEYSKYERGNRTPPTAFLEKLAIYYNTNADYLIGLTNVSEPYERKTNLGI